MFNATPLPYPIRFRPVALRPYFSVRFARVGIMHIRCQQKQFI